MADELPPVEIPWQLASTTQPLGAGPPEQTSISIFTFQPEDDTLSSEFPGQSLVFLKVTCSISPAAFPPGTAPIVAAALGEGIPCYHVQLDMTVRKRDGQLGTIRPYFHAAAPLRREMLQTGVIGAEAFEGESNHQFVGKSGSQMYETSRSTSRTSTMSFGAMPLGIGVSGTVSSTGVSGSRSVTQVSDVTSREASQERHELVSHMTNVENILTLLSAKYVGTPYLRFSLSPRPLQNLSADSSDPSLWFGQLLQRRSSGIEGVQEFTTVILVPKGEDFCVTAGLRRVCVLDDPPGEPDFNEAFSFAGPKLGRLLNYFDDLYPRGTPVEELDIDITPGFTPKPDPNDPFPRPVVETWWVSAHGMMLAEVVSTTTLSQVARTWANYKTFVELWLETLRSEYDRDLARSPLERGTLVGETRQLDTCFTFGPGGLVSVINSAISVSPLAPIRRPPELDRLGLPVSAASARSSTKARALETVTRWNTLERMLATVLDNGPDRLKPGKMNDVRIVQLLLDRWAKLRFDDPLNLGFRAAMDALGMSDARRSQLKEAGVTDLKSLAQILKAAPVIERYNSKAKADAPRRPRIKELRGIGEPIPFPMGRKDAAAIMREIGNHMLREADNPVEA